MSQMADLPSSTVLLAEGASETFNDSGSTVTWRFEVPYGDRNRFLRVVAGLPQTFTYGSTQATRLVPLQNPSYYNCFASSIQGVAIDGAIASVDTTTEGQPGIYFDFYRYDVTFTTPSFGYDGTEPLITVGREIAIDSIDAPGTGWVFPSDNAYVGRPVDMPVYTVEYELTFHRLPNINDALYDSLAGCVSTVAFRGNPAGYTLYMGCSSTGEQTLGGSPSYDATHRFQVRSIPWQQIMRPDGKGFEAPVWASDNTRYRLPSGDLNQLYGG